MKWLLDEMLPPAAAECLRQAGHDAISVSEASLAGAEDAEIFALALTESRIVVTENFADYTTLSEQHLARSDTSVAVVFVHKSYFGTGKALASNLASRLIDWATHNPNPYPTSHWL